MSSGYPRDLIGYGANPPDPQWPGDARLAVQIVMNYEEGSEYSIPDGDERSETYLTEVPGASLGPNKRISSSNPFTSMEAAPVSGG